MDTFFKYLNSFPLPLWLAMMLAPRHPLTERLARSSSIFALGALHYVISLIIAIRQGADERQQGGQASSGGLDLMSLGGIRTFLGTPSGALAAWAHMLALDLFTGGWIYRQCRRLDAPDWVRIGSLFFTLMTGPLGLLIFLLWRYFGAGADEGLGSVHKRCG